MPARGPEPSQRMSLAIFISAAASVLSAPDANTNSSCEASAANLLGCERNGSPSGRRACGGAFGELGMRVQAGADGGAADREIVEPVERFAAARDTAVELAHVAGELLAQRQRRRILEMRASDLDDRARIPRPSHRARRAALTAGSAARPSPPPRPCASRSGTCRSRTATC